MSFIAKNVRTRLTLWYVLAFTTILIFYALLSISLVYVNFKNSLDDQLQQDYEIVENLLQIRPDNTVKIESEDDPYFHERWFQIWSSDWNMLYESRPFSGKGLPPISKKDESKNGLHFHSLRLDNKVRVRALTGKINIDGQWLFIRLIRDEEGLWEALSDFSIRMLIALPLALFIAGFGGYFLTKKFLAPIDNMTATARKIGEENLKDRLPVINPDDELGDLARVFNDMLERIQKSFERLKQFTSDAAHELRTPLTAIRSIGEVGMQEYKDAKYYREILGSILEENRRLTQLVDNLLFLSRADEKMISQRVARVELKQFIQDTVEFIHVLAEEKNQSIVIEAKKDISVIADRALLKQALLNILDNAIKHSPQGSQVTVRIDLWEENTAYIEVTDNGPGIAPEHLNKIFKRFYRIDKGRTRGTGGSGLGLAIARWAVRAQGGKLTVESQMKKGSSFRIILPLTETG